MIYLEKSGRFPSLGIKLTILSASYLSRPVYSWCIVNVGLSLESRPSESLSFKQFSNLSASIICYSHLILLFRFYQSVLNLWTINSIRPSSNMVYDLSAVIPIDNLTNVKYIVRFLVYCKIVPRILKSDALPLSNFFQLFYYQSLCFLFHSELWLYVECRFHHLVLRTPDLVSWFYNQVQVATKKENIHLTDENEFPLFTGKMHCIFSVIRSVL
jgi:hypothetical protein